MDMKGKKGIWLNIRGKKSFTKTGTVTGKEGLLREVVRERAAVMHPLLSVQELYQ